MKTRENPSKFTYSDGFVKNYNNLDIFGWKDLTF